MADEFVRVRLVRITGVDLNVFEFDYDLSWAAFFMNASGKVYGRFGGRDALGPDTRNSLAGLHYAMQAALVAHRKAPTAKPVGLPAKSLFIEKLAAKMNYGNSCIHCHQVKEILRQEQMSAGTWQRDSVYTYPLPENIGITLDLERGNLVKQVQPNSAAARAGIKPGDFLDTLNQQTIHSFADAQYALHKAPAKGQIAVAWQHESKPSTAVLTLEPGWRHTNITWRPSMLDLLPALTVYGSDLTIKEKKALGLADKRLAFRQEAPVPTAAKALGVQENDIILGVDGKVMEMSMPQFLGYVRQHYLIGETLTLNMMRAGKRLDLPVKLK